MSDKKPIAKPILKKLRIRFDWNSSGKLLVYSIVAGVLAGLLAAAAYSCLQCFTQTVQEVYKAVGIQLPVPSDYTAASSGHLPAMVFNDAERKDEWLGLVFPRYWILLLLIPALGGLLCGLTVWSFAPEATSEATDSIVKSFHYRNGMLRNRLPFTKWLAGLFTLGSGGSAGHEGLMALLGSGTAGSLAQRFPLNIQDKRILLLAGAAGGIGAVLQVPLGGAFYAVEMLYATTALELSAFIPCVLASVAAYLIFGLFHSPLNYNFYLSSTGDVLHVSDLLFCLLFIPIIAALGLLFVHLVSELRNRVFRRLAIPEFFKPALGGFLLGCIALIYPQVLGGGYEWFAQLLHNELPFLLMLYLIVPKMLATALTVSSGGSGGLLAPSLLIGGLIGGTLGHCCYGIMNFCGLSSCAPDITVCILVGMGTFYAGIGKLPLTAAVIVCEMTGLDYWMLIPLLLLNLLHLAIQSPSTSLYEEQVLTPLDSEAHFGNYSVDLLRVMTVQKIMDGGQTQDYLPISSSATIPQMIKQIAAQSDTLFPVIDERDRLTGILLSDDVWTMFHRKKRNRNKWGGLTAKDISLNVRTMEIAVLPTDDLYTALRTCMLWNLSAVPILEPQAPERLLGILRRDIIIAAYNERLAVARWD